MILRDTLLWLQNVRFMISETWSAWQLTSHLMREEIKSAAR